jgi:hypothetical protein
VKEAEKLSYGSLPHAMTGYQAGVGAGQAHPSKLLHAHLENSNQAEHNGGFFPLGGFKWIGTEYGQK